VAEDSDSGQADSRGGHVSAEVIRDAGANSGEDPVLRRAPERPLTGSVSGGRAVAGTALRGGATEFHLPE
jgi:hypothetical protein